MNKKFTMLLSLIALMLINLFNVSIFAMRKRTFSLDLKKITPTARDDYKDEGTKLVLEFCKACNNDDAKNVEFLLTKTFLVDLLYDSHAVCAFCDAIKENRLNVVKAILNNEKASTWLIERGANFHSFFKSAFQVVCLQQYLDMATALLTNKQVVAIFSSVIADILSELSDVMNKIKHKDKAAVKNWLKTAISLAYNHTVDKDIRVNLEQIKQVLST